MVEGFAKRMIADAISHLKGWKVLGRKEEWEVIECGVRRRGV